MIILYEWCRGSNTSTTASNITDAFGEGTVMEAKMLRWTVGVTRLDRVCNDTIRQWFGVVPISDKLREARLRWYNHVLRANDDTVREPKPWGTWKAAQKSPEATFARIGVTIPEERTLLSSGTDANENDDDDDDDDLERGL
ncbi:unnamed protein product [Heligmosomoides polygyrus]|uniref:HTH myb-type domain-containing protein n=1 Tax=Heligmosomoides polygyrus TaxID=6339 RepID=A0A183GQ84_HELPZ|nr:unnamed protein product [Heligmosomoides polygyrus]